MKNENRMKLSRQAGRRGGGEWGRRKQKEVKQVDYQIGRKKRGNEGKKETEGG